MQVSGPRPSLTWACVTTRSYLLVPSLPLSCPCLGTARQGRLLRDDVEIYAVAHFRARRHSRPDSYFVTIAGAAELLSISRPRVIQLGERLADTDPGAAAVKITTRSRRPPDQEESAGIAVKTYRTVLGDYRTRLEAKSLTPDGRLCRPATKGLLQRRPVTAEGRPVRTGRKPTGSTSWRPTSSTPRTRSRCTCSAPTSMPTRLQEQGAAALCDRGRGAHPAVAAPITRAHLGCRTFRERGVDPADPSDNGVIYRAAGRVADRLSRKQAPCLRALNGQGQLTG